MNWNRSPSQSDKEFNAVERVEGVKNHNLAHSIHSNNSYEINQLVDNFQNIQLTLIKVDGSLMIMFSNYGSPLLLAFETHIEYEIVSKSKSRS